MAEYKDGKFTPKSCGIIAENNLKEIPSKFENIALDEFIIMPNHLHAILIISNSSTGAIHRVSAESSGSANSSGSSKSQKSIDATKDKEINISELEKTTQNYLRGGATGNKNPMLHKNISTAIRQFKGKTTLDCRKIDSTFSWHVGFYDIIVRDTKGLERVRTYIRNNPQKWEMNKDNLK